MKDSTEVCLCILFIVHDSIHLCLCLSLSHSAQHNGKSQKKKIKKINFLYIYKRDIRILLENQNRITRPTTEFPFSSIFHILVTYNVLVPTQHRQSLNTTTVQAQPVPTQKFH